MLQITPQAGLAVQRLAAAQGADRDGGLRIDTLDLPVEGQRFRMSVAVVADELDQVVTEELTGAHVLLDSLTAELLEERMLDVDDTVEGRVRFRILPASTD